MVEEQSGLAQTKQKIKSGAIDFKIKKTNNSTVVKINWSLNINTFIDNLITKEEYYD